MYKVATIYLKQGNRFGDVVECAHEISFKIMMNFADQIDPLTWLKAQTNKKRNECIW